MSQTASQNLPDLAHYEQRLSEQSQEALRLAQQEAIRRHCPYIGTEHILLGMLQEGSGLTDHLVEKISVDRNAILSAVEKVALPFEEPTADVVPHPNCPLSYQGKAVLQSANSAADEFFSSKISTGHLLRGLLATPEGVAALVLKSLGITRADVDRDLWRARREEGIDLLIPAKDLRTSTGLPPTFIAMLFIVLTAASILCTQLTEDRHGRFLIVVCSMIVIAVVWSVANATFAAKVRVTGKWLRIEIGWHSFRPRILEWSRADVLAVYGWNDLSIATASKRIVRVLAGRDQDSLWNAAGWIRTMLDVPDSLPLGPDGFEIKMKGTFWEEPFPAVLHVVPGQMTLGLSNLIAPAIRFHTGTVLFRKSIPLTPTDLTCRIDAKGQSYLYIAPAEVKARLHNKAWPQVEFKLRPLDLPLPVTRKTPFAEVEAFQLQIWCSEQDAVQRILVRFLEGGPQ